MIDFYAADFGDEIAKLDRDGQYVIYCRSGNRSGQTAVLMQSLGFTNVADVNGGILAWQGAGLDVEK
jgi:rhodanese-related sulfurtransferase